MQLLLTSLYFLGYEFGNGWYPAIINNQDEANFIRQVQREFTHGKSYYIGGSTNTAPFRLLGLSAYRKTTTGSFISKLFIHFLGVSEMNFIFLSYELYL